MSFHLKLPLDCSSRQDKAQRHRHNLSCAYCRPHRGENRTRTARNGGQKPKRQR